MLEVLKSTKQRFRNKHMKSRSGETESSNAVAIRKQIMELEDCLQKQSQEAVAETEESSDEEFD